jgi:hypothetical protein
MRAGLVIGVVLTMTAITTGTSSAASGGAATRCKGGLDSGTYRELVVPAGATCDGTDAFVHVRRGVRVRRGGTLILGSEDLGAKTGTIRGGIHADSPASLQVHFARVRGGVRMNGGDGYFSTVEDNVIHGRVKIRGYSGTWLGFIRNRVHGNVLLSHNVMDDPDANEYVSNEIFGDLVCHADSPAPQLGDSGGEENVVSGRKAGQCSVL